MTSGRGVHLSRVLAVCAVWATAVLARPIQAADPTREGAAPLEHGEDERWVSGGVEVVSRYVQRGMSASPDLDATALQPWVDAALPWGFYLGYWGSNTAPAAPGSRMGFENDLSAGWSIDLGQAELKLGATYYVFLGSSGSDVGESALSLTVRPTVGDLELGEVLLGASTMLGDSDWGHAGDTYLLLSWWYEARGGWSAGADLGFQGYVQGPRLATTENLAFRHLDLSIAREIAATGLRLRATWMIGGVDREGEVQPATLVWGAGFRF